MIQMSMNKSVKFVHNGLNHKVSKYLHFRVPNAKAFVNWLV